MIGLSIGICRKKFSNQIPRLSALLTPVSVNGPFQVLYLPVTRCDCSFEGFQFLLLLIELGFLDICLVFGKDGGLLKQIALGILGPPGDPTPISAAPFGDILIGHLRQDGFGGRRCLLVGVEIPRLATGQPHTEAAELLAVLILVLLHDQVLVVECCHN